MQIFFWWNRHRRGISFCPPHNSQRIDAKTDQQHNDNNNDNTLHHISTHANTHKHTAQTHHTYKHLSISSTDAGPHHSKWTRGLHRNTWTVVSSTLRTFSAQRGMGDGPRTLKLRASQGRVYRESQLDGRSLSSSLNRERES